MIMVQIITGLADPEIQKDVLSLQDPENLTLDKLIVFVEGKEAGLTSQGLMTSGGPQVSAQNSSVKKPSKCR